MHALPPLPYAYDALEPYVDEPTMRLHHLKHHQAYIDKLNATLEKYPELAEKSTGELLRNLDSVPEAIRTAVRNHGGGHWNHSFFWKILTPASPNQGLALAGGQGSTLGDKGRTLIENFFGSVEEFQKQFKDAALGRFGSGWVWLVKKSNDQITIISTANQDVPFNEGGEPLLGLDVWEHAYYLKYQNRRADYVDAFFKIINWEQVGQLLTAKD